MLNLLNFAILDLYKDLLCLKSLNPSFTSSWFELWTSLAQPETHHWLRQQPSHALLPQRQAHLWCDVKCSWCVSCVLPSSEGINKVKPWRSRIRRSRPVGWRGDVFPCIAVDAQVQQGLWSALCSLCFQGNMLFPLLLKIHFHFQGNKKEPQGNW